MTHDPIQVQGQQYQVQRSLGRGGEGQVFEVRCEKGTTAILKRFHESADRGGLERLVRRTRFLVDQQLEARCPLLTPPLVIVEPKAGRSWCGYLCRYRPGLALTQHLEQPAVNLLEHLLVAIGVVWMVHRLHDRGISHGDLHPGNVIVERVGDLLVPSLIDLDNFSAPGTEPPRAWGALQYMAPELRAAYHCGRAVAPDILADLFALTCLLHELLLLRHIASDFLADPRRFEAAMVSGTWHEDPARGEVDAQTVGGLSNLVLSANLAQLFRRGVSVDPQVRPSAQEWLKALLRAAVEVYLCPGCGYPTLVDATKRVCPCCRQPYPTLTLVSRSGRRVRIDRPALEVGRRQWESPRVSARHAVLRRIGPETWIEPCGSNGTWRWLDGSGWEPVPQGERHLLEEHDRVRMADVELTVERA